MSNQQDLRPPTQVLTRGFDPTLSVGSARPAVFRSSTYVFPSPEAAERAFDLVAGRAQPNAGEQPDLIYSRFNHPNAEILEARVVPLETGAHAALVFNSGMAAIMTALFTFARPGQNIIYTVPIYGGTQHLIEDFLSTLGIGGVPVEAGHTGEMDEAIRSTKNLAIVLIETPANPTIVMTDIRHATDAAARLNPKPLVMVDNTLLGPTFQHPLLLGADLSLYSATKYLSGLSDLIAGIAIASDPNLIRQMRSKRNLFGNILQPDECWMLEGRLPTVTLRMNRSSKNAERIAIRLAKHPKSRRAFYIRRCSPIPNKWRSRAINAISRAACCPSSCAAARKPRSSFSATCASRATPYRWAAWKRWCAIPRPPRIPDSPKRNSPPPALPTGWCAFPSASKTGAI